MKRILFLTNTLPFPGNSGGTKKTKMIIDNLVSLSYHIDLFFLLLPSDNMSAVYAFKKEYETKINISFVLNKNNKRNVFNYGKSLIKGRPLNVYRNYSKNLMKRITALSSDLYNIVFCDHIEMFQYIPKNMHSKTILHEHNAEYIIWSRYASIQGNCFIKLVLQFEATRYKKYELSCCKKAGKVLAAPDDILMLQTEKSSNFEITYHLGDDTLLNRPKLVYQKNQLRMLFIGTMTWEANIHGCNWFIQNVLPIVKKTYPSCNLDVIGKFNANDKKLLHCDGVVYHGFVDDLEEYFQKDTVFICPLLFGSGMKIKVVEAMYRGIPIVTTTIGAENIKLRDGKNCYIADDKNDFASKIINLYEDKILWNTFSETSRQCARANYTWKDEINRITKVINEFE